MKAAKNGEVKSLTELLSGFSQIQLAECAEVTQQAVSIWFKKGVVPPRHCPRVSELTRVPKSELNPLFKE